MIKDHSGFEVRDLFIKRKYKSFKQEIMNYGYISIKQYNHMIINKAAKYMDTNMVRSIKAFIGHSGSTKLYYGVVNGAPLRIDNLVSVILYTDFTDLSSNFTSTFRKISPYETLSSIKARNSRYWWMSKTLRETVELYGIWRDNYYGNRNSSLVGPFYTGMSYIMNIPQFAIRLCSPTSTSIHMEVAMKFSGETGIIIQLNTTDYAGDALLAAFDVSWISRYKEEDERYNQILYFIFSVICFSFMYIQIVFRRLLSGYY